MAPKWFEPTNYLRRVYARAKDRKGAAKKAEADLSLNLNRSNKTKARLLGGFLRAHQ